MRILAIGITFCLVFYTACVSQKSNRKTSVVAPQNDYDASITTRSDSKENEVFISQNDYDAGMAAYKRGHYRVAFSNFELRAMEGDPIAQFCLGFMYKNHGEITVTDRSLTKVEREVKSREEAIKWYTKAADQGYLPAQNNLGVVSVRLYEESNHENLQAL